jgi:putative SOS response-associated peptidase YedK
MCGRVTLTTSGEKLAEEYALSAWPKRDPRYNLAPTQLIDVIRTRPDGTREIAALRWGFIADWSMAPYQPIINARCETVAKKPGFRTAFQRRRCLIPVDGFFEWRKIGRARQPYLIRMRDHMPYALAGLWERCETDPSGPVETCTVLTTNSNSLVAPLHDRMPVIIAREHFDAWLDPATVDYEKLKPLLQPYPAEKMETIPVNKRVNDVKNDDPDCVAQVVLAPQIIQGELDFG